MGWIGAVQESSVRKLWTFSSCLVFFAVGLSAQTPSFDCSKASTPQEKAICASPELRKLDSKMGVAYRTWLAAAPVAWRAEIRENQRVWLRLQPYQCHMQVRPLAQCLSDAEKERTKALRSMVLRRNGILFVWRSKAFTAPDSPDEAQQRRKFNEQDFGYVSATWPQAVSSAPEWVTWNKVVADAARDAARSMDSKPGTEWSKNWAADADTDISIRLNAVTDSLVTAAVMNYRYGHGAAHGLSGTVQINWLLKEQRKLKTADVFQPQIDWPGQIYDRTDKYLHSQLDEQSGGNYQSFEGPGQIAQTLRKLLAEPDNWQIDSKGITILFPAYAVACYACTPPPFTMSWESLKPLLNPEFPVPTQ